MRRFLGRRAEVFVPAAVLQDMEAETERHAPEETGGVLLGYTDRTDARRIQVTLQLGPGPRAVHRRHFFDPDSEWQAHEIAAAYASSGRVSTYLGDWHSHPGGSRRPSGLDRSTARRIALCGRARASHPVMLILHGEAGDWRLAAYRRGRWQLRTARATVAEAE
jgi:integrative and conjugative element protein (TIGR02256 family)